MSAQDPNLSLSLELAVALPDLRLDLEEWVFEPALPAVDPWDQALEDVTYLVAPRLFAGTIVDQDVLDLTDQLVEIRTIEGMWEA